MLVPVCLKKVLNTGICARKVNAAITMMSSESMALSVTTVPSDLANDTPSHLFNTPQRMNSPARGISRLVA